MSSQSWPGRLKSSMYSPAPRMNRGSSLRLTEWPMPPTSGVVWRGASIVIVVSPRSAGRGRLGRDGLAFRGRRSRDRCRFARVELAGCLLDRLDDVHVAGAAAEVAADPFADLRLGGFRVPIEEPGGLHDHSRGAEAALQAVLVPERLLEGMQRRAVDHALDRPDLGAVRLDREHGAGLRAAAVHVNGAGAAVARVAADVGAGQPEHV